MRKLDFTAAALVCGAALLVGVSCGDSSETRTSQANAPAQSSTPGAQPQPPPQPTPVETSANELVAEARQNGAALDQKYKGREMFVLGSIEEVSTDPATKADFVRLNPGKTKDGTVVSYLKGGQGDALRQQFPNNEQRLTARISLIAVLRCRYDRTAADKPQSPEVRLSDCEWVKDFDERQHPRLKELNEKEFQSYKPPPNVTLP